MGWNGFEISRVGCGWQTSVSKSRCRAQLRQDETHPDLRSSREWQLETVSSFLASGWGGHQASNIISSTQACLQHTAISDIYLFGKLAVPDTD